MRTEIINGMTVHMPDIPYEISNLSKEQILSNNEYDVHYYGGGRRDILTAMEEYAKKQSLLFTIFSEKYKKEELTLVKKEQERLGGIISWISTPDDKIYDLFIAEQGTGSEQERRNEDA